MTAIVETLSIPTHSITGNSLVNSTHIEIHYGKVLYIYYMHLFLIYFIYFYMKLRKLKELIYQLCSVQSNTRHGQGSGIFPHSSSQAGKSSRAG